MPQVRLIHWNEQEARRRADTLRDAGYSVVRKPLDPAGLRALRKRPPDAVVIDLGRLPSHGRDVGLALRTYKDTRGVPIVFVDGDPAKVERIRDHLPDAEYTTWRGIRSALRRAIANPPADPAVPTSNLAGYSGTPLPKKLGIRAGETVALVGAPPGFEKTLGALPEGVTLRKQARGRCDLAVWFVRRRRDLEARIDRMAKLTEAGALWIAWPKKASGVAADFGQNEVRRIGLDHGLVDFKVCAIDATWSALKFTRRRDA